MKMVAVLQTYSQTRNDAQVHELVKKAHETKHGERSLPEYQADCASVAKNTKKRLINFES